MIWNGYHATLLSLEPMKEKNGYKKAYAVIETLAKKDEAGDEVYKPEIFEVVVPLQNEQQWHDLKATEGAYFPATFSLRSFTYQESGKEKRAKELQLKRWKR